MRFQKVSTLESLFRRLPSLSAFQIVLERMMAENASQRMPQFVFCLSQLGGIYMRPGRTQTGTKFLQPFTWDRDEMLGRLILHETGTNSKTADLGAK